MVRSVLAILLCACVLNAPNIWAEETADLSPSPTPITTPFVAVTSAIETPPLPPKTTGHPFEDIVVVSLVSLPFTAFWSTVGALVIGGVAQNQFPPEIDDALLTGIGIATVVSSLGVGLFSAQWGPGKASFVTPQPQTIPPR